MPFPITGILQVITLDNHSGSVAAKRPRMSLTEGFGPCDSRHEAGTEVRGMAPPSMILGEGSLQ